jgi:hypothetical protein
MSDIKETTDDECSDLDLGDGYDSFCNYVSLKNHFNKKAYDWNRYEGRVTIPREAYERRKDKKFFQIIQKRYSGIERNQIFLANFVYNKHLWIGELLADNCIDVWNDWKGRITRIDYQFEEDLKNSLGEIQTRKGVGPRDALKLLVRKPSDSHPLVLRFVWGGMFGIESYLLLSIALDLGKVYQPFLLDDSLWADFEFKVGKYMKFLRPKLNIEKAKETLKRITKE